MNNQRGFVAVYIILAILVAGGLGTAVVQREVLKSFFEKGDKPTEAQFSDTIDSALNVQDDGQEMAAKEYNPSKAYVAGDTVVKTEAILQAKVLSQNQSEFKLDAPQSITFRWEPNASKEPMSYRLKVWQLMQGQNGTTAMRTNKPIVTKDVDNVAEATIGSLYTGPCRPPYLCEYVWSVEVVSKAGAAGTVPATGATVEAGSAVDATGAASTGARTQ